MSKEMRFVTRDNQDILIRHLVAGDAALLVDMFHHLSDRTKQLRFHTYVGNPPEEMVWKQAIALSRLDPTRQKALIALVKEDDGKYHAIGVARFNRETPTAEEAEGAIVVRDDFQRLGIGTRLLFGLVHEARAMGIKRMMGWILADNRDMLHMINKIGLPLKQHTSRGETQILIQIDEIDNLQELLNLDDNAF